MNDLSTLILQQNTPEWIAWRKNGVGGSEVPVLMGESEYSTPLKLWRIKRGLEGEQVSSFTMQRGHDLEPKIRALYELEHDIDLPPALVEHSEYPFLRVSLDGWNQELKLVGEFKFNGKEKHQEAKEGRIPRCHYGQVQYQLMVTGAEKAHYVSYSDTLGEIAVVEQGRDEEYISRMMPVVEAFWLNVVNNVPPPLSDRDFMTLDQPEQVEAFEDWKRLKLIQMQYDELLKQVKVDTLEGVEARLLIKKQLKDYEKALDASRAALISLSVHPRIYCSGVQMIKQNRKNGPVYDIRLKEVSA